MRSSVVVAVPEPGDLGEEADEVPPVPVVEASDSHRRFVVAELGAQLDVHERVAVPSGLGSGSRSARTAASTTVRRTVADPSHDGGRLVVGARFDGPRRAARVGPSRRSPRARPQPCSRGRCPGAGPGRVRRACRARRRLSGDDAGRVDDSAHGRRQDGSCGRVGSASARRESSLKALIVLPGSPGRRRGRLLARSDRPARSAVGADRRGAAPARAGPARATPAAVAACTGAPGTLVTSATSPDLDQSPVLHDRDPVADVPDHRQVVGDEEVRDPGLALDSDEQVQHASTGWRGPAPRPARRR